MIEQEDNPKWFYKPLVVNNLTEIQSEVIPFIYKKISDFDTATPQFVYVNRDEIESTVPSYVKYIDSLGLLDKWVWCAIITTNGEHEFPIHVDSYDWKVRCYGLNLPIINCEGTYTVWYDAEIEGEIFDKDNDPRHYARRIKPDTIATEIGRWDMSNPAWINTSIPHRPVSTHNKPRAVISARFRPELHKMLYL